MERNSRGNLSGRKGDCALTVRSAAMVMTVSIMTASARIRSTVKAAGCRRNRTKSTENITIHTPVDRIVIGSVSDCDNQDGCQEP